MTIHASTYVSNDDFSLGEKTFILNLVRQPASAKTLKLSFNIQFDGISSDFILIDYSWIIRLRI